MGGNISISNQALTLTTVQDILINLASLDGTNGTTLFTTPRTLNLGGGTSAGVAAVVAR